MNNKRQTIWLVSMLSLMVILSAYYLFTEDAPKTGSTASGLNQSQLTGKDKTNAANPDGIAITEVDQTTDELTGVTATGTGKGTDTGSKAASGTDDSGLSPEDQQVLNGISSATGNQRLEQMLLEQRDKVSATSEKLNAIIGNTKVTPEEAQSAAEQLSRLEETDERITSLQTKLLKDYDNAVVDEEDSNFNIIVLSEKLEKKQAIKILDLATKELNVTPDRVSIQYVQQ
ncbi:SpoIIIAH-like family protein [Cohnella endophytica]|nr:SpoIIIAH-like family protein [Cohnella endophytica]